MSVTIKKSDINAALGPSPWDLGNRVLYRLCEDHPDHNNPGVVISKIWLIGRAYAAAIERRKEAMHTSDDFYGAVVGKKLTSPKIDKWLSSLPVAITAPWKDLEPCVRVHKRLMDMFSRMTGLDKRSLASKYLHFHRPDLFYIYDSRARNTIQKITPRISGIPAISEQVYDKEYRSFCRRAL